MSDLIDTTEMYLKTVFELTEEGVPPLRARIAERLGHSGPTVSQTVARMERDGLLRVGDDRLLSLTDEGRLRAMRVMRKHRLAERLLADVIGLEWPLVHDEACRWEHVMSEDVERRLAALLDNPDRDAYGNPIPGMGEIGGDETGEGFLDGVVPLLRWSGGEALLARIGEPLQVDVELLTRFAEARVVPGGIVDVESGDGHTTISVPGGEILLDVPDELARHIFVRPLPA